MSDGLLQKLLLISVTQKASDLHLSSGSQPYIRVNGLLQMLNMGKLLCQDLESELINLLTEPEKNRLMQNKQLDFAYYLPNTCRCRVNIFYQYNGISAVFRIIDNKILSLTQLGAPLVFQTLITKQQGLILITGSTGSGKSTTLKSIIQHINLNMAKHIIVFEDPIEFIYQNVQSLIQQREVISYDQFLEAVLRQDPDIIVIGELRNKIAIKAALTAAETGHLVIATLHTDNALQTIHRFINVFDANHRDFIRYQLAESLQAIISQQLVLYNDNRKALFEILINTSAVSNLIKENKIKQIYTLMQTGKQVGMQLFSDYQ